MTFDLVRLTFAIVLPLNCFADAVRIERLMSGSSSLAFSGVSGAPRRKRLNLIHVALKWISLKSAPCSSTRSRTSWTLDAPLIIPVMRLGSLIASGTRYAETADAQASNAKALIEIRWTRSEVARRLPPPQKNHCAISGRDTGGSLPFRARPRFRKFPSLPAPAVLKLLEC